MVTENHYRWDFIGLSTDDKPTPATSPKVVDGSTFYCSDTSKLYVFCKTQWYERKPLGAEGITLAQLNTRLDNLTLLVISASDYDELTTKDPDTLYIITAGE